MVLKFDFDKDGMKFRFVELPIDTDAIARWNFRKSTFEETVARKFCEQGERLKHIFSCITGQHQIKLQEKTWEAFCRQYIIMVGTSYANKTYTIKVVYNDRGYTTFPDRAISPFIVGDEYKELIQIDPRYDHIYPPEDGEPVRNGSSQQPAMAEYAKPDSYDEDIPF